MPLGAAFHVLPGYGAVGEGVGSWNRIGINDVNRAIAALNVGGMHRDQPQEGAVLATPRESVW